MRQMKTKLILMAGLVISATVLAPQGVHGELPEVPEPDENPVTEAKRVLGKILFWEEQLSSDNTVACGTCHIFSTGGADQRQSIHPGPDGLFGNDNDTIGSPGVVRRNADGQVIDDSVFGFGRQVTGRASPGITMSMYDEQLFWDGRADSRFVNPLNPEEVLIDSGGALESQAVGPILSTVEMAQDGRSWADVTGKLTQLVPLVLATEIPPDMAAALQVNPDYPALFDNAFGDTQITPGRIGMAIATYERTLIPDQTPWDQYMAGDLQAMTPSQIAGWESFSESTVCDNCHVPPEFTDHLFYNIGLRPSGEDTGRMQVTSSSDDAGRFKTPSLRNSGLKLSLMHVGWIVNSQDAIDYYNTNADAENGIANPHVQFTEDQTGIPTQNPAVNVEYDTLSMFSNADNPTAGKNRQAEVADFITNGLTDPRVAAESFPFDRPTLRSEIEADPISPTAFTGSWYDPSHDGEGWMVEFTDRGQAVVTWYSYTEEGKQMWLLGVGTVSGNIIVIEEMLRTRGGIFGPLFDPADVEFENWGTLLIEFHDCDSATFNYSSISGMGTGVLNAVRLTELAGLECES